MPDSTQLALSPELAVMAKPDAPPAPSALAILQSAISGGVTRENVEVVKELLQMARDQRADEAKAAFARAFFQLRKNMPVIYADKERKDLGGYRYCSEEEISKQLEPHLTAYGFSMLPGQSQTDGRITIAITLMHEAGHSETREYTVRTGRSNAAKDDSQADAGASTTAWRHLCIKMFGLKSRIQENQDARNEGEKIARDKVQHLEEVCAEFGGKLREALLEAGGVSKFEDVGENVYPVLTRLIEWWRAAKKAKG